MIWYRVGSRFEAPGITGISHFLEHLMFKGTAKYVKGEIDDITTRQGGNNNAFTSLDYTAYYFNFASDRWWQALEIEADRMVNNTFDREELELERSVILEEIKMDLDSPWGALRQKVETSAFQVHPYRFPVIGHRQDVQKTTRDQIVQHYKDFYVPNNAVLVIAGDFETDEVLRKVEDLFQGIPPGQVSRPASLEEPPRGSQLRLEVRRPTQVPKLLAAFPAPSVQQDDHFALHLLDLLISQGKLSRLYRRMVEGESITPGVHSDFSETWDPYLFFISLELYSEEDFDRAERIIFEEIDRLASDPVSEEELDKSKNQCINQFLSSLETPLDQTTQLGHMETLDGHGYWNSYPQRIEAVTPREIQRMVERWWAPEQTTLGRLRNGSTENETPL